MKTEFVLLKEEDEDITLIGTVPGSPEQKFHISSSSFDNIYQQQFQANKDKLVFFLNVLDLNEERIAKISSSLNNINKSDINVCVIMEKDFLIHSEQNIEVKYNLIDTLQESIPNLDVYICLKFSFKKNKVSNEYTELLSLWNKAFKFCKHGNFDCGKYTLTPFSSNQSSSRFNRPLSISTVSSNTNSSILSSSPGIFSKSHSSIEDSPGRKLLSQTPLQEKESVINSISWTNKYIKTSPYARAYVKYMSQRYERTSKF